ncbi:MAG: ABC transporter ATP-binding protein [Deltaproteobacteria bacterium]|nr:ABC transporter ATP-binding protein [Deltaproteobacteria bacterium]
MAKLVSQLWHILDTRAKRRILLLLFFFSISGFLEIVVMSLLLPLISFISQMNDIQNSPWYERVNRISIPFFQHHALLTLSLVLLVLYLTKNIFLLFIIDRQTRWVSEERNSLSKRFMKAYIHAPYMIHLERETHRLSRTIELEVTNIFDGILWPILSLINEALTVIMIFALLLIVSGTSTIIVALVLLGFLFVYYFYVNRKLANSGARAQREGFLIYKWIDQTFLGIKEVKIFGSQKYFFKRYSAAVDDHSDSVRKMRVLGELPRPLMEIIMIGGALFISLIIFIRSGGNESPIPILGLFIAAAYRIMPSISRFISCVNQVSFFQPSIEFLQRELDQIKISYDRPKEDHLKLKFDSEIEIQNISFRYKNTNRFILKNLSHTIKKNHAVAFFGPSGSGKSTMVNLLLGLLEPSEGKILSAGLNIFDDLNSWRKNIGYVSQTVFVLDGTVRENIAFGIECGEHDDKQIWSALAGARLYDYVKSLPEGLNSLVGDKGIRFSGGQRQRLGLARALYFDPKILILDEVTAGLDTKTEKEILSELKALVGHKTLIIVSHKEEVIHSCSEKIEFHLEHNEENL